MPTQHSRSARRLGASDASLYVPRLQDSHFASELHQIEFYIFRCRSDWEIFRKIHFCVLGNGTDLAHKYDGLTGVRSFCFARIAGQSASNYPQNHWVVLAPVFIVVNHWPGVGGLSISDEVDTLYSRLCSCFAILSIWKIPTVTIRFEVQSSSGSRSPPEDSCGSLKCGKGCTEKANIAHSALPDGSFDDSISKTPRTRFFQMERG